MTTRTLPHDFDFVSFGVSLGEWFGRLSFFEHAMHAFALLALLIFIYAMATLIDNRPPNRENPHANDRRGASRR